MIDLLLTYERLYTRALADNFYTLAHTWRKESDDLRTRINDLMESNQ